MPVYAGHERLPSSSLFTLKQMAAPSVRGMLLNEGLQHQEGLNGHWETGEDEGTRPSPVARP